MKRIYFPRCGGDLDTTDYSLLSELRFAGIPSVWDSCKIDPEDLPEIKRFVREASGSVRTSTYGELYGWSFTRMSTYWEAKGPGLSLKHADRLYDKYGTQVRVGGDCSCPSPMAHYKGLACGYYHVDTFVGLRALADTIKLIVEGPHPITVLGIEIPALTALHQWLARA